MTKAPGTIVRTPAAASTPQSIPAAPTVRVMVAAIGLAPVGLNTLWVVLRTRCGKKFGADLTQFECVQCIVTRQRDLAVRVRPVSTILVL